MELIDIHGNPNYKCGYCRIIYPKLTYLRQHLESWHPCCIRFAQDNPASQEPLGVQLDYPCHGCRINYRSTTVLINQHFSMPFCPQSRMILSRIATTGLGMASPTALPMTITPSFGQCRYCGTRYPSEEYLKQHLDTWRPCCIKYHGDNPSALGFLPHPNEAPCFLCKLVFGSMLALAEHENTPVCRKQKRPSIPTSAVLLEPLKSLPGNSNVQLHSGSDRISDIEAMEQAIKRDSILHEPDQFVPSPCDFCRGASPVFWKGDVHKICTACKEKFLDLNKQDHIYESKSLREDSVMELTIPSQLVCSSPPASMTQNSNSSQSETDSQVMGLTRSPASPTIALQSMSQR